MNPKIHDLLKEAGVANGILHDEAEIVLLFSNPELFGSFREALKRAHEKGDITQEEHNQILFEAEEVHRKALRAQQNFRSSVIGAHKDSLDGFYQAKTKQLQKETKNLAELQSKIQTILKKQ